jgi:hypothetical protein
VSDPRDYKLEISGVEPATPATPAQQMAAGGRPFLRVRFECCGTYTRVYRTADGTHYRGGCPRCGKPVRFEVGPGGTDSRDFVVR